MIYRMNHPRALIYVGLGLAIFVGALVFVEKGSRNNEIIPAAVAPKSVPNVPENAGPAGTSYKARHASMPEIISFSASSNLLTPGQSVTLTWKSKNTDYCQLISNEAYDSRGNIKDRTQKLPTTSGELTLQPTQTTTYELSCLGPYSRNAWDDTPPGTFSPVKSAARVFVPYATTTIPMGYQCYSNTGNSILLGENKIVEGVNNKTFSVIFSNLGEFCMGADEHHVYSDASIWSWADPNTFDFLGFSGKNRYMFRNKDAVVALSKGIAIPNSDANSFSTLASGYEVDIFAIDKNNVYCVGKPIPGADPTTAQSPDGLTLSVKVHGVARTFTGKDPECR